MHLLVVIAACSSPSDGGNKPVRPALTPVNGYTFVDSTYGLYRALPGWDSSTWPLTFFLHCVLTQAPVPSPAACNGAQLTGTVVQAQSAGQVFVTVRPAEDAGFTNAVDFWLAMFPDIRRDWALHVSCMAGLYLPNVGPPYPRWIVLRAQMHLISSRVNIATATIVSDSLALVSFTDTVRVLHNNFWADTTDRGSDLDNLINLMSGGFALFSQAADTTLLVWGNQNGGPNVGFKAPVSTWHPLQFHATGHVLVANSLCGGYSDTGDTNFVDLSPR